MIDFVALCQEYRVPIAKEGHHCTEGWVQTHCPFCMDGRDGWHLGFNLEFGNFNCWKCGKHSLTETLSRIPRLRNVDPRKLLRDFTTGGHRPARTPVTRQRTIKPPDGTGPLLAAHRRYLRRRGFHPKALESRWDIQATRHLSGGWNWRIVVPICDSTGRIVAYQGRAIGAHTHPKYRTTHSDKILQDPRSILYGIERAKGNSVIIVEGVPDVWRLGPGAVATLGIDWKPEQANILRQFHRRFIMFDPDAEAQRQAEKLGKWLSYFPGKTVIIDKAPSDPGDLSDRSTQRLLNEIGFG